MSDYKMRLASLDRNVLKANFIDYLKSTSEFQNFNFDASGIATILDLLSYNTYYQSMTANVNFNEAFMDTATKRQNVVSRAAELGYVPYTSKASKATVQIKVTNVNGNPTSLTLSTGLSFSTTINNKTFNFCTLVPYTANVQVGTDNIPFYIFTLDIYEGILSQNSFVYGPNTIVEVPNLLMDSSTLRVFVTLDTTEYEFYAPSNFLTATATDKVYYLNEGYDSYTIGFGTNNFGMEPSIGSSIRCLYLVTNGSLSNNAALFAFTGAIPGATSATVQITVISGATGGVDREQIDSIKVNAINMFKTQDRAVTSNDYKSIIISSSTNVKDVLVWGGEKETPPQYGRVVACIEPRFGDILSLTEENIIRSVVAAKSVPNIGIIFKSPVYMNIIVDTNVTYDNTIINQSIYDMESIIRSTISNFINSNLSKFNGKLRYSNLTSAIDRVDPSIMSNVTTLTLKMKYSPVMYQAASINFSFNNALDNINKLYAVKSSLFYTPTISGSSVWIEDDSNGNLNLYYSLNGVKTFAGYNIGTIDYNTGNLNIPNLTITGIDGITLDFSAIPVKQDILNKNETIIRIDSGDINLTTVAG